VGSVQDNGAVVCVFQIAPRQKRAGLIRGHIWIDSGTGVAIRQAGRFVKRPSVFIRGIDVVRDRYVRDGISSTQVMHVAIDTRLTGHAELTITESPLRTADRVAAPQLIPQRGAQ
jgi:hypothetical protein